MKNWKLFGVLGRRNFYWVLLLICASVQPARASELEGIFAGAVFLAVGFVAVLGTGLLLVLAVQRETLRPDGRLRLGWVAGQALVALAPLTAWAWLIFSGSVFGLLRAPLCYVLFVGTGLGAVALLWRWRPSLAMALALALGLTLVLTTDATTGWQQQAGLRQYREMQENGTLPVEVRPDPQPGIVYDEADPMPAYAGGHDSLRALLRRRLYPIWRAKDTLYPGCVWVRFVVEANGRVGNVAVSSGGLALLYDEAAAQALDSCVFAPGRRNNQPTAVYEQVILEFSKQGEL